MDWNKEAGKYQFNVSLQPVCYCVIKLAFKFYPPASEAKQEGMNFNKVKFFRLPVNGK